MKKKILISILMMFLALGLVGCSSNDEDQTENQNPVVEETDEEKAEKEAEREAAKEEKYQEALALEDENKESAMNIYEKLNDYKDAAEKTKDLKFELGMELMEEERYTKALVFLLQSEKYDKDSEFMSDIYETIGDDAVEKGKTKYALSMYKEMQDQSKYEDLKATVE